MLDVRRLKVLKEVAEQGSFSAAAESLAYTQSAVSQQIAALEREAGTLLVQRNPRGVRLTDAGTALLRHTEVILSRLADAQRGAGLAIDLGEQHRPEGHGSAVEGGQSGEGRAVAVGGRPDADGGA